MLSDLQNANTIPLKSIVLNRPSSKFINKIAQTAQLHKTRKTTILYIFIVLIGILLFAAVATNHLLYKTPFELQKTQSKGQTYTNNNEYSQCKNTEQGKEWLADDKGYVCLRKHYDATTHCCKGSEVTNITRYSCNNNYCNISSLCCNEYEFCVTCCMHPNHYSLKADIITQSKSHTIKSTDNHFDYCRAVCRTNSKSLLGPNKYRSQNKYCFGDNEPPLISEISLQKEEVESSEPYGNYLETSVVYQDINEDLVFNIGRSSSKSIGNSIKFNIANWLRIVLLGILLFQLLLPIDYGQEKLL